MKKFEDAVSKKNTTSDFSEFRTELSKELEFTTLIICQVSRHTLHM